MKRRTPKKMPDPRICDNRGLTLREPGPSTCNLPVARSKSEPATPRRVAIASQSRAWTSSKTGNREPDSLPTPKHGARPGIRTRESAGSKKPPRRLNRFSADIALLTSHTPREKKIRDFCSSASLSSERNFLKAVGELYQFLGKPNPDTNALSCTLRVPRWGVSGDSGE